MKRVYRKPDKRYWVVDRVQGRKRFKSGSRVLFHHSIRPDPSLVKRSKSLEKQGYDTRIWQNREVPAWVLFRSRRKK